MKTPKYVAIFLFAAGAQCFCRASELVDRVVAVVNDQVILQSDVDEELRFECLSQGKLLTDPSCHLGQAALNRLVERALIEQRLAPVEMVFVGANQVRARASEIRKQLPLAQSEGAWQAALAQYGFTEEELLSRVTQQLNVLRFIDSRFRPLARVSEADVEAYYRGKLVPDLANRGAKIPALPEVSAQIESLLIEQRIDDLLNTWLKNLRSQSKIKLLDQTNGIMVDENLMNQAKPEQGSLGK